MRNRYAAEKINNRQLFFLLTMIRGTLALSTLPVLTTADALQDAWASSLITFLGSALLAVVIIALGTKYPTLTAVQYGEMLLGKFWGRGVILLLFAAFIQLAAVDLFIYAEVLTSGLLTETPSEFLMAAMTITAAAAALCGIEVIGRSADIIFPLSLVLLLGALLTPIPELGIGITNLEPVLARGMGPVLRGSIVPIAVGIRFLVLAVLIPSIDRPKKILRTALGSIGVSTVIIVLTVVVVLVILGPEPGSQSSFPLFSAIRGLQVSEFLERIDPILIFAWGFGTFISLSVFLYCAAISLSQIIGVANYRPLVSPLAILLVAFAVHSFDSIFQLRTFQQPQIIAPYYLGALFLLPMSILWLGYFFRGKRGGNTDEK